MKKEFENKLKSIISECIHNELIVKPQMDEIKQINEKKFREYVKTNYASSLNEMARINTKEFYGYFPYNKFRLVVWSNDHNPPHFHVICDENDIKVNIIDGTIMGAKVKDETKIYNFVEKNVNAWLDMPSAVDKTHTNRETAMLAWRMNNPDEDLEIDNKI